MRCDLSCGDLHNRRSRDSSARGYIADEQVGELPRTAERNGMASGYLVRNDAQAIGHDPAHEGASTIPTSAPP